MRYMYIRDGRFGYKVDQIGPQIGQIRDFFRSDFSTFGSTIPAVQSRIECREMPRSSDVAFVTKEITCSNAVNETRA